MSSPSTPSTRHLDWVPLFVPRSGAEPLATTFMLPPHEHRRQAQISLSRTDRSDSESSSSSSSSSSSDPDSPTSASFASVPTAFVETGPMGLGFRAAVSSGVSTTTEHGRLDHGVMQRGVSNQGQAGHIRRRSSSAVVIGRIDNTRGGADMERMRSLTSMMDDPLNQKRSSAWEKAQAQAAGDAQRAKVRRSRRLLRYCALGSLVLLVWIVGRGTPTKRAKVVDEWMPSVQARLKMPTPQSLYDSFETIPYPTSTHPRTPTLQNQDTLSFADYLTTRLGSHFSLPPSRGAAPTRQPSHLWLTVGSNRTISLSAPHLVAFIHALNAGESHARPITDASPTVASESEFSESNARRELVILCRDQDCMVYCRERPDWYCFGGFIDAKDDGSSREGEDLVKLKGTLGALGTGRRVFFVDNDVYFREDPLPHLGILAHYDLQIPDSFTTGQLKAGFVVLNPSRNVMSLYQRLLDIASLPTPQRRVWSTANLLLDPSGAGRDHDRAHNLPLLPQEVDEKDDGLASSYGQSEFVSPWAGGIDVKVLDRKMFKTSSGKLAKMDWNKERASQAIYHHCVCCGDSITNDYIAGALGYHQPSIAYEDPDLSAGLTKFPFVLKTPTLSGTREELSFAMSLMLQLAHDSNRTFIPPLKGTLVTPHDKVADESSDEESDTHATVTRTHKYIWRLFPLAHWAHGSGPGAHVSIVEPSFALHLVEHLKRTAHSHSDQATRRLNELQDTLYLDLNKYEDYKSAVRALKRRFLSTTKVVMVEGFDRVHEKKGWTTALRHEWTDEVRTCKKLEDLVDDDGRDSEGQCVPVCQE